MKILFISRWFPYPADNGSKLRIYSLLRHLSKHHQVTLISFADSPRANPAAPQIRSVCEQIVLVPIKQYSPDGFQAKLSILNAAPRYYKEMYSPEMAGYIEEAVATGSYDLVIASQIDSAAYVRHFQGVPAIFDEVEIGVLYDRYSNASSYKQRVRNGLTWEKHRRYLTRVLKGFQACTVASIDEQRLLQQSIPDFGKIYVFPNCIEYEDYQNVEQEAQPNTLIFTGSFRYAPNYDAMEWFIQKVLPQLRDRIPDVKLIITGDPAGKGISHFPSVVQTGFVEDIRSLIAGSWVSLAPLLSGGGTRLKILEGMALGVPVVATTKGAQGLDVRHGWDIMIADSPEDFFEAVYSLCVDPKIRDTLGVNGKRLVREKYSWESVMPDYLELIERIAVV